MTSVFEKIESHSKIAFQMLEKFYREILPRRSRSKMREVVANLKCFHSVDFGHSAKLNETRCFYHNRSYITVLMWNWKQKKNTSRKFFLWSSFKIKRWFDSRWWTNNKNGQISKCYGIHWVNEQPENTPNQFLLRFGLWTPTKQKNYCVCKFRLFTFCG